MRKIWNLDRGDRNVLEILHEIDSHDWWGDGDVVTADAFRRELNRCNGEMNVLINSPGGDVFAAADIYTALREYSASRGRVICYVTGIAASAGQRGRHGGRRSVHFKRGHDDDPRPMDVRGRQCRGTAGDG